jgi:hypothetical protein
MRNLIRVPALAVLTLALALANACASSGTGEANRASFQRTVGTASAADATEKALKVLSLFQFEIRRQDQVPSIVIETEWRQRSPFPDELAAGIEAAENRVFVTGRRRAETELGPIFNVSMAIENRVRRNAGGTEWVETSATPMYRQFADSIFKLYQRELTIGVRRY